MDFTSQPLVVSTDESIVPERHTYSDLGFRIYRKAHEAPQPAVIFVNGFPDPGMLAMLGKRLEDWASYIGWARLVAGAGMAAITYENRTPNDVALLLQYVRANASSLGIDPDRIALWACSGSVPTALSLIGREKLACAALLYGLMLDVDGSTDAREAAARFHCAPSTATFEELPRDLPLLIVRATKDETPGLDPILKRFMSAANGRLNATIFEHEGPHAFDLVQDTDASRTMIGRVLEYLRDHL
jgi:hypothetical protein